MKNIKIFNKYNIQTFEANLEESEIPSWLELIGDTKGKPERWILENSESYDQSDILETEERFFNTGVINQNEDGTFTSEKTCETWVKLRADYTIEIIDLESDYDWLLSECHRKRVAEYPPITELGDALYWKEQGNDSKYISYMNKCDEVKKKYPLPIRSE